METIESLFDRMTRRDGDCIEWTRALSGGKYGSVWLGGKCYVAHRLFYTYFVGAIPAGHHLHHVCGNKKCVRPSHLSPVTPREHSDVDRGYGTKWRAQCPSGHAYDETNTIHRRAKGSNGRLYNKRFCRACKALDEKRRKHRQLPAGK